MKLHHTIALLPLLLVSLATCKKESGTTATTSSVTTLTRFYLSNDSVLASLKNITFTIDNDKNIIYNTDSLPYLCKTDSLIPTMYGSTLASITINDTITYSGNDTIDFTNPVTVTTTATDGTSTRTYIVTVNVHQIDPDVYNWTGIKSEIFGDLAATAQKTLVCNGILNHFVATSEAITAFTSPDGTTWTRHSVSGLPNGTNVDGIVTDGDKFYAADNGKLYAADTPDTWAESNTADNIDRLVFTMNGKLYAFGKADGKRTMFEHDTAWHNLGTLPDKFPSSDFAVCVDAEPSGKNRAYIVGGKTTDGTILGTVWSSENGSYWANLAASKEWFAPRYGAAIVQYADGLMLIGGADENGICSDSQWYSPDYGLTWKTPDEKALLPDLWVPRYGLSMVIDSERYVYIVGGKTDSNVLSDVWKGRKNSEMPEFKQ